jgi:hypothetical protein
MELKKLGTQERSAKGGATHEVIITHADLTESTANTSQVIAIKDALVGDLVSCVGMKLVTPFKDASDTAFNSNTVQVGDDGSANRFLASTQVNENGTEILFLAGTGTSYAYLADNTIDITVGSMSGKSLSDIDVGELRLLLKVIEL